MKLTATLIGLIAAVGLVACGDTPTAAPTMEPVATIIVPTPTPEPTLTPNPTPSPTPVVSPTATPQISALFEYSRAVRLLQVQEYDDSVAAFGLVIRKLPDFGRAYRGRALAYFGDERYRLAMEDFDTAISLEPDFAETYVDRARLHIELGDTQAAITNLEMALKAFHPVRESRQLVETLNLLDSIRK
ncbi:tetratricopeptide repeat protein [Dehalococcoidia bacterium]|nr:tetratricopeptide repeat protein [Dehalococcoidia bacterium]